MGRSTPQYDASLRHRALELRASGLSWPEVSLKLAEETGTTVPKNTLLNWGASPDGKTTIAALKEQYAAMIADRAHGILPQLYDEIEGALTRGDAKSVDALSRALVNVSRGVIAEKVELTHAGPDPLDELAQLLHRHGVQLEQRGPAEA